jgi:hypothetical protein
MDGIRRGVLGFEIPRMTIFVIEIHKALAEKCYNSRGVRPRLSAFGVEGGEILIPVPNKPVALKYVHNPKSRK